MASKGPEILSEPRLFTGTVDRDSDLRSIAEGDYRDAYACFNGVTTNRGTVVNLPSNVRVVFQLPAGDNECIGAYEDVSENSVIFHNYNSNGRHGIYRWFRYRPGYVNGVIDKIIEIFDPFAYTPHNPNPLNYTTKAANRIHSPQKIDNNYFFTDARSRSKFVDLSRANEKDKRRKFNIYFNRADFGTLKTLTFSLRIWGQGTPVHSFTYTTGQASYKGQTDDFITNYQASGASQYYQAVACIDYPEITMNSPGEYYFEISSTPINITPTPPLAIPQNFYPDKSYYEAFSRDLIDELVYTGFCQPSVEYFTDSDVETNFVKNKAFQFCVRYIFFDNSISVTSARSVVPLTKYQCGQNSYTGTENGILIDFTDERLANAAKSSIIKQVQILATEPAIEGSQWNIVAKLDPYEFTGPGMQQFKFYNNRVSEPVDSLESETLFSALPITYETAAIVDDRKFADGGVANYDPVCIDAEIDTQYGEPQEVGNRHSVTGNGVIYNFHWNGSLNDQYLHQAMFKMIDGPYAGRYFFGSARRVFTPALGVYAAYQLGKAINYLQEVPLGGFVVYLAGTSYYGITRQKNLNLPGLPQEPETGAFLLPNTISAPTAQLLDTVLASAATLGFGFEYEIQNVPNGRYVLRMASQQTTADDLGENSLQYQKTSTTMHFYISPLGLDWSQHEYQVVVASGNAAVGQDMVVHDVSDPRDSDTPIIESYLVDDDNGTATTSDEAMGDTHIERHRREYHFGTGATYYAQYEADHNGFSFYGGRNIGGTIDLTVLFVGHVTLATPGTSFDVTTGGAGSNTVTGGMAKIYVYQTVDTNISQFARTVLQGTVNNGAGQAVVNTRGAFAIVATNGTWDIYAYAPPSSNVTSLVDPNQRDDRIIYCNSSVYCMFVFAPDFTDYSILIGNFSSTPGIYNEFNHYILAPDPTATQINSNPILSALHRGGDYDLFVEYLDEGDRRCRAILIDKVHILFFSEPDEEKYPAAPHVAPLGPPVVRIKLYHEPPEWAVKYHILISKNQQLSGSFTWMVNKVVYKDGGGNITTSKSDAKTIELSFDNLSYYATQNPQSTFDYTFEKGDRIRFISLSGAGVFLTEYLEYEVLQVGTNSVTIPVDDSNDFKEGAIFQIYHPRGEDQESLGYEFGQCYKVESVIQNGLLVKRHTGNIADQEYLPSPSTKSNPAIIELTWGDSYYRQRNVPYDWDGTLAPKFKLINIISQSVSDFYASNVSGYGRVNSDSEQIAQLDETNATRFSDRYIEGTLVNGLRHYQPGNVKRFSKDYGSIRKLILMNKAVLKAIFDNSFTISMYINQGILRSITKAGVEDLLSLTDDVIPKTHEMQRNFGTRNPESIVHNDKGELYGWDENEGVVWMMVGDGFEQISDLKMVSEFSRIHNHRNALGRNNSIVNSRYDKERKVWILSFLGMDPQAEKQPCVTIPLRNMVDGAVSFRITLVIRPLNQTLIYNVDPTLHPAWPDFSEVVIQLINQNNYGYVASKDDYGNVKICAPPGGAYYTGLAAQLTFKGDGTAVGEEGIYQFSYVFEDGYPAAVGDSFEPVTWVFCREKNGWIHRYPFYPETYSSIRDEIVSFRNGELWVHNDTTRFNWFYGVKYDRKVTVVFNKAWQKIRTYRFMQVNCLRPPYIPNIDVLPTNQNALGMNTEIVQANFREVFGKFWAKLPKDKLTPWKTDPQDAWANGREIRGQVMTAEIVDTSQDEAPMVSAEIGYLYSERS